MNDLVGINELNWIELNEKITDLGFVGADPRGELLPAACELLYRSDSSISELDGIGFIHFGPL